MTHFTNEELISFIPTDSIVWDDSRVRNSKKTQALLGWFIFNCGLEEYKVNGSFYRSNTDLMKDIETTSDNTLIEAINKLVLGGYINRTVGTRKDKKASIYSVDLDKINTKRASQAPISNPTAPIDYSTTPMSDWSSAIMEQNNAILLELKKIGELLEVIASRTTPVNNYATMPSEWSTDTDTDTEIEKEKDIELNENIYSDNIIDENENIVEVNDNIQSDVNLVENINYTENNNTEERLHIDNPLSVEEVMEYLNYKDKLQGCVTLEETIHLSTLVENDLTKLQLEPSVLQAVKENIGKDFQEQNKEIFDGEIAAKEAVNKLIEHYRLSRYFATYDEMSSTVKEVEGFANQAFKDGAIDLVGLSRVLKELHTQMDYRLDAMRRAKYGSRA